MSPVALSVLLADEEALLARLYYQLTHLALLAATGRHAFLAAAADEATDLADDLGALELARAMMVADLASAWGAAADQPTLAELCELAPPDWRPVLEGHLGRLRDLQASIVATSAAGSARADEALVRLERQTAQVEARWIEGFGQGEEAG